MLAGLSDRYVYCRVRRGGTFRRSVKGNRTAGPCGRSELAHLVLARSAVRPGVRALVALRAPSGARRIRGVRCGVRAVLGGRTEGGRVGAITGIGTGSCAADHLAPTPLVPPRCTHSPRPRN